MYHQSDTRSSAGFGIMLGMFRVVSLILAITFASWVMPLGVFIKPKDEKMACDGQRAFHMCSMMQKEAASKVSSPTVSIMNASGQEQGPRSQSSGGDNIVLNQALLAEQEQVTWFMVSDHPITTLFIIKPLEHPPQVASSKF